MTSCDLNLFSLCLRQPRLRGCIPSELELDRYISFVLDWNVSGYVWSYVLLLGDIAGEKWKITGLHCEGLHLCHTVWFPTGLWGLGIEAFMYAVKNQSKGPLPLVSFQDVLFMNMKAHTPQRPHQSVLFWNAVVVLNFFSHLFNSIWGKKKTFCCAYIQLAGMIKGLRVTYETPMLQAAESVFDWELQ